MIDFLFALISIVGAVGLFIFGMKIMSESIQRFAGKAMRNIVDRFASSPVKGVFTGFVTTALIQSSSAATVMIVSFANAGIFKLKQAISLIMGANIGTTLTAWLFLVFGFSKVGVSTYIWPLLAIATPLIFWRKSNIKNFGNVLFGFSIMFLGLGQLKKFFESLELQYNDDFITIISNLGEIGFGSILIFLLIGTLLAVIVQSSTVAMGFTLALCSGGLPLELGAALVLGENLGTTSTANIAAIVANVHGKRAARAHTLFNLISICWFLIFFKPIVSFVEQIISLSPWGAIKDSPEFVAASLAFIHSFINIVNMLFTIGFIGRIEKFIIRFTKSNNETDNKYSLEYLEHGITSTSVLYVLEAKKQLIHFGLILRKMQDIISQLILSPDPEKSDELIQRISQYENLTDNVQTEVSDFLTKITRNDVSENLSTRIKIMLSVVSEMERIADKFYEMSELIKEKNSRTIWFDSTQRNHLKEILELLNLCMECMFRNLKKDFEEVDANTCEDVQDNFNLLYAKLRSEYFNPEDKNGNSHKNSVFYFELLLLCKKAADNCRNVTIVITKNHLVDK